MPISKKYHKKLNIDLEILQLNCNCNASERLIALTKIEEESPTYKDTVPGNMAGNPRIVHRK